MNPPWSLSGEGAESTITLDDFKTLNFSENLISNGFIFIWIEKPFMVDLVEHFTLLDFRVVETICWVMVKPEVDDY
jgi:hypothetical protein